MKKCSSCNTQWNPEQYKFVLGKKRCPICESEVDIKIETIVDALEYIVELKGKKALKNQNLVKAILKDLLPNNENEINLVEIGIKQNVADILLDDNIKNDEDKKRAFNKAVRNLENNIGMNNQIANKVVAFFAEAIGWNINFYKIYSENITYKEHETESENETINNDNVQPSNKISQDTIQEAYKQQDYNDNLNSSNYINSDIQNPNAYTHDNEKIFSDDNSERYNNYNNVPKKSKKKQTIKLCIIGFVSYIFICMIFAFCSEVLDSTPSDTSNTMLVDDSLYEYESEETEKMTEEIEITTEIEISKIETTTEVITETTTESIASFVHNENDKFEIVNVLNYKFSAGYAREDIDYRARNNWVLNYDENAVYYYDDENLKFVKIDLVTNEETDVYTFVTKSINTLEKTEEFYIDIYGLKYSPYDKCVYAVGRGSDGDAIINVNKNKIYYSKNFKDGQGFPIYDEGDFAIIDKNKIITYIFNGNSWNGTFLCDLKNNTVKKISAINSNLDYLFLFNNNYYVINNRRNSSLNLYKLGNIYDDSSEEICEIKIEGNIAKSNFDCINNKLFLRESNNTIYRIDPEKLTKDIYIDLSQINQNGINYITENKCMDFYMAKDGGFLTYDLADNTVKYIKKIR